VLSAKEREDALAFLLVVHYCVQNLEGYLATHKDSQARGDSTTDLLQNRRAKAVLTQDRKTGRLPAVLRAWLLKGEYGCAPQGGLASRSGLDFDRSNDLLEDTGPACLHEMNYRFFSRQSIQAASLLCYSSMSIYPSTQDFKSSYTTIISNEAAVALSFLFYFNYNSAYV
jgi:hypothetical protein